HRGVHALRGDLGGVAGVMSGELAHAALHLHGQRVRAPRERAEGEGDDQKRQKKRDAVRACSPAGEQSQLREERSSHWSSVTRTITARLPWSYDSGPGAPRRSCRSVSSCTVRGAVRKPYTRLAAR